MGAAFHTKVVGVTKSNDDGMRRQSIIARYCVDGMEAHLRPEPHNPHDPNAIGVWITCRRFLVFKADMQIGYLSAELAAQLTAKMQRGRRYTAVVSSVTGGAGKHSHGVNLRLTET